MATSRVANVLETGRKEDANIAQDVSNPARDKQKFADPSGETMKALVWLGKNDVAVVDVPKPKIIEDTDAILKVTGTTICGSDLHLYHGSVVEMQKGDIMGHEFCGEVESVGVSVKNLKKGDRVVASFQIACGDCKYCKQKLSSQCERTNASQLENEMYGSRTAGMFGYSHLTGGFAGGQAEYVRVPYAETNLLPLPANVPDEKGLYLSDVLGTAWHCVVDTGVQDGDVVAIWGAGPIGQMCAEFSFMHGADRVIIIDGGAGAWRLGFVKEKLPRVETVDFSTLRSGESVTSVLKEMVRGGQGPDVALECAAGEYAKGWAHYIEIILGAETDTSEILNEMVTSVRNFGRCGITGIYVGYTNHFNIGSLMQRGVRLIGNGQAPIQKYWEHLLSLVKSGELDPLQMVSTRIKLEDLDLLYRMCDERKKGIQKVFVQTKFSKETCPGSPALAEYE
ncbi:alcohol dehydrogenase [Histoplasma capsulatum var. duboisii H88]|uniref:Alcohol dehydrogenase n=1 Tax=Ajellomyces capsulatus (strain H88) TaxID=544711 RepID=F0UQ89_AJEC8|nr:alcohol dehydrogenase [Histoplasma capsulatum var. duboisii H88]